MTEIKSKVTASLHTAPTMVEVAQLEAKPIGYSNEAFAEINDLREAADKYHEEWVVRGRNALKVLMAQVYTLYVRIEKGGMRGMAEVRVALETAGVAIREDSKESSLLVRYIFKDFDYKQVSVHGTVIRQARKDNIEPNAFIKYIDDNNGFEGVRQKSIKKPTNSGTAPLAAVWETGYTSADQNRPSLGHIDIANWKDGETFRVVYAIRNDDDTAELRDPELTIENAQVAMNVFTQQLLDTASGKKRALSVNEKRAMLVANGDEHNAEMKSEDLRYRIASGKEDNKLLKPLHDVAAAEWKLATAALKALRLVQKNRT